MSYCMYLRKSRKDEELEQAGIGETLSRHYTTLLELSQKMNILIHENDVYKEIVSGDSIACRPVVQNLLSKIEQGLYEGVFVMDIERLARGDTIDQGIVSQTFQLSNTKIITPLKTYDPSNEYDQEYFEFGLFMARREYKTINRRLQQGRMKSIKEGKYVGNIPPYGYDRVKIPNEKGFTLKPNSKEAQIVQMIFDMYINQDLSQNAIARKLNNSNIRPRIAKTWSCSSIKDIISNPVYIGKIRWNKRKIVKTMENGKIKKSRPQNKHYTLTDGIHEPIIDIDTWNRAQAKKEKNLPRLNHNSQIQNPLQGLVICSKCGSIMQRRPYLKYGYADSLMCPNKCGNISSKLYLVENKIINALKEYTNNFEIDIKVPKKNETISNTADKKTIKQLKKEIDILTSQLQKAHNLLEQEIYDINTFIERKKVLLADINQKNNELDLLNKQVTAHDNLVKQKKEFVPTVKKIIEMYNELQLPKQKSDLLKTIIKKIEYSKTEKAIKKDADPYNFKIKIFFNLNI